MNFQQYFQSYEDYFWQWEEQGAVITIPESYTIAYREHVNEVLEVLKLQGLPPFGSLLLVIAATNSNGRASIDAIQRLVEEHDDLEHVSGKKAFKLLKMLANLPDQYKKGKSRMLLFQSLFQDCHKILSVKKSHAVLETTVPSTTEEQSTWKKKTFSKVNFHRDFRTLELIANRYKNGGDILSSIAQIPEVPKEVLMLEPTPQTEVSQPDLIDQLIKNHQTFYVGSLIKRIWSGLQIPLHSKVPSHQPFGGVADITNKGTLDRLLISEYAHEGTVFLSRLANNEALYHHREAPPEDNNYHRVILIDTSLKNWGSIKTIAFATMMAIAKHPKGSINCTAFAIGEGYHPIGMDTVDDLITSLQLLDTSLHAANGLQLFFKEQDLKNKELFLISSQDALKYPAMQKELSQHRGAIQYWLHPKSNGELTLYKSQINSKRFIQTIQLPLADLWKRSSNKKEVIPHEGEVNYPILFKLPQNVKQILLTQDQSTFLITKDKVLLKLHDKHTEIYRRGWEMIEEQLPFISGNFALGKSKAGDHILLMLNFQTYELTLWNIEQDTKQHIKVDGWKASSNDVYYFRDQQFYFVQTSRQHWTIDLNGTIKKKQEPLTWLAKAKEEHNQKLSEVNRKLYHLQSILKNVKRVFINQKGHLVFNLHQLYLNVGEVIKLDKTNDMQPTIEAEAVASNHFLFPDGSSVFVKRAGMLVLRSGNEEIPDIYVPSVLDRALGVATDHHFSGNEYYYREKMYDVELVDSGEAKLKVVKIVKQILGYGLKQAKEIVDAAPTRLVKTTNKEMVRQLGAQLKSCGAKIDVKTYGRKQERLTTPAFFRKYIQAFINQIKTA